jgi:phosphatidylserine/phosphatidylglycerophosphate/cardiolipin synthase-like enzyme
MQLLVSPWAEAFEQFGRSIRHHALLVAPFIARGPLEHLTSILDPNDPPKVELLTNLAVDSLLQGSIDAKAIASFCRMNPNTTVRHLPGLHAKAYVADEHLAIITSGNLTRASLYQNYEYGIQISDRSLVRQIARDLRDYGELGAGVSLAELDRLAEISETLRTRHDDTFRAAQVEIRREFERQLEVASESQRHVRAKLGKRLMRSFLAQSSTRLGIVR